MKFKGIIQFFLIAICCNSYSQNNINATVYGTIPIGANLSYAIVKVNGEESFYKTSAYESKELRRNQKVELLITSFSDNDAELFGSLTGSRIFCKKITQETLKLPVKFKNENKSKRSQIVSPFPFCKSDPNPVGGDAGYSDIFDPGDATIHIQWPTTTADIKNTIESAPSGSIIYIDDNLTIDLTGFGHIEINNDIVIASGRGNGIGALFTTSDFGIWDPYTGPSAPIFRVLSDQVRITGLRFEGPSTDVGNTSSIKNKSAIYIAGYDNLEVDNCEFWGFPYAAVRIGSNTSSTASFDNNLIHHNYFHENRQNGLGYGVVIDLGYAEIYQNIFFSNRHDIAGTGAAGSGYEAYCNTVLQGGVSHNFDMHAEGAQDSSPNAGKFIYIHHNDFQDVGGVLRLGDNDWNIYIRGRPDVQCRIENNKFAHETYEDAIIQRSSFCAGYGNMLIWNNLLHEHQYKGVYVHQDWNHFMASNEVTLTSTVDLIDDSAGSCEGSPLIVKFYDFGDYDGDGKTDVYKYERVGTNDANIYTIPLDATGGFNDDWTLILTTNHDHDKLRFGFYNADSKTDLLVQDGNSIYMSDGVNSPWSYMLYTGYSLSVMKSGDFDANGVLDLFLSAGGSWYVSYNSNSSWQYINSSGYPYWQMDLGTFDYDNKSDVFMTTGSQWNVSYGGTSSWNLFKNDPAVFPNIQIADFNHDDRSDVIRSDRYISLYGYYSWKKCDIMNFPITTFPYGDF